MSKPASRFAFIDDSEALRRLGVDRKTLEQFIREKRLRAYGGVGKDAFFKANEVEALYAALHPAAEAAEPEEAPAEEKKAGPPRHDPAMRVHLRLQADLKWFDISDGDIDSWFRELRPDGYQRQRSNILEVMRKLQRMLDLIDANSAAPEDQP
ncbi:MAG TPA: hypothetical protein VH599_05175 [Ktedonobacterales bacterium]|jgi:hypothetical protein